MIDSRAVPSPLAGDGGPRVGEGRTRGAGAEAPSRRALLAGAGAIGVAAALRPARALAQETESHGLSVFGDLRYPAGFPHFAYVRPDAPKGGSVSLQITATGGNQAFDTFNTLNTFVLRGDGAAGMDLTYDSLMVRALDEPDSLYGLVAQGVSRSPDGLVYRFRLRPEARFRDGTPLTAADVAWTFATLKEKGHPRIAQAIRLMERAEAEAPDVVRITFSPGRSRDLPLIVAGLPILSEASWRGRDFEAATLEAPLGSGPYRVGRFEVGRFVAFERNPAYWGASLPVNVGRNNFDEVRFEYFRDRQVAFEAFKAGAFTYREEFTARIWATGYDFPAVAEGKVKRETLPDRTPQGMQAWFFNLRREPFRDPRIREAIGLAFDFEWTNATVMYGAYTRTASYFENSVLKAEGPPSPEELALLEPHRARLPASVFGEPFVPPRSDGSGQSREHLRRADALLREAGCRREGTVLKLPSGAPLAFEFLDNQPIFQPHVQPFIRNLGLLGIAATSRIVDPAQYQRRTEEFDFDVVVVRFGGSSTPGEGLRQIYGSAAAAIRGSQNLAGIADPTIDALLDVVVAAETRPALTVAVRALDRVLRAGRYCVPMWYRANRPLAHWDVFGRPSETPEYGLGAPDLWWYDAEKAKRTGRP